MLRVFVSDSPCYDMLYTPSKKRVLRIKTSLPEDQASSRVTELTVRYIFGGIQPNNPVTHTYISKLYYRCSGMLLKVTLIYSDGIFDLMITYISSSDV